MTDESPHGEAAPEESAVPPGVYRHFKGNRYRVYGVATHSETGERLVSYRTLYGDHDLWVRPLTMFVETVEHNGETVPRFSLEEPSTDHEVERRNHSQPLDS